MTWQLTQVKTDMLYVGHDTQISLSCFTILLCSDLSALADIVLVGLEGNFPRVSPLLCLHEKNRKQTASNM